MDDISHLQYTSGSTRPPVGVEVTHRAVGTNLVQMILSIDLLDRNTHGVSWLPLYHDMGLSMIGFPAVYGGHSTLMSPTAFVRRPQRWIQALSAGSRAGRVVTAAPNFAYEWTAQRGLPAQGDDIDLSNVVMIIGSEPVSIDAIRTFTKAFAPYGLPRTAFKPSYGIAEATLFVATIDARRRGDGRVLRPRTTGRRSCGTRRGGVPQRRGAGVVRSGGSQPVGRDRQPAIPRPNCRTVRSAKSGCRATTLVEAIGGCPTRPGATFGAKLRIAARRRQPCGRLDRRTAPGCGPATWVSISTVSSTSPAGSWIW